MPFRFPSRTRSTRRGPEVRPRPGGWLPLLALVACLPAPALAQFVDRTDERGLTWFQSTWGAAFADFDGDGDLDLYVGHHFFEPVLWWNDGTGHFDAATHPQPWIGLPDRHGPLAVSLDFDTDLDLFIAHGGAGGEGSEANELYRNDGGGSLISFGGAGGMSDPPGRTRCASAADYDGDHVVDVWVGKAPDSQSVNSLFRGGGLFAYTDVAAAVGLDEGLGTVGGIWGDVDGDGDPDLLVGGEEFTRPTILWRNDGGTFVDASSLFSPALPVVSGADWGDFDLDGDLDLAVCDGQIGIFDTWSEGDSLSFFFNTRYADSGLDGLTVPATGDTAHAVLRVRGASDPMLVFLGPAGEHPPPLTEIELTDAYVGAPSFTPGVDQGIFVWRQSPGGPWEIRCSTPFLNFDTFDGWLADGTIISGTTEVDLEHPSFTPGAPRVWRNDGNGFVEVSAALGLPAQMLNPRDISWIDYDNDGDLDLHVVDLGTTAAPNAPDLLMRNDVSLFRNVSRPEGVQGGSEGMGDGATWGDIDADGDLDLYLAEGAGPSAYSLFAPSRLLVNEGDRGPSIQLTLVGRQSGKHAMGTVATVVVGGKRIVRTVVANSWRGFQDAGPLHFGLGGADAADSLVIAWASGAVDVVAPMPSGIWTLDEGGIPTSAPGAVAPATGAAWALSVPRPQPARGEQRLQLVAPPGADVEISVLDVAGRRVRTLGRGPVAGGTVDIAWNGRGDDGLPVPAGVYWVRASDGLRSVTRRCVRLR